MGRFRIALATVVTLVWATGYVLAYLGKGHAPEELSALMVLVLGWALAGDVKDAIRRRIHEATEDPDEPGPP